MASPHPLSAPAAAAAVLANPAGTWVRGPRPMGSRRFLSVALACLAFSAGYGYLAQPLSGAIERSGAIAELAAWRHPPPPVTSAPATTPHWVALPTSPFLEAGRLEDGSLSTTRMLSAWVEAGLDPSNARDALQALARLRPVLMGRRDPVLEAELVDRATQAAEQLARRFPVVSQRLDELVALRAADPAFLSASDAWKTLPESVREDAGLVPEQMQWSIATRMEAVLEWNKAHPAQAYRLPALARAGVDPATGSWSTDRALRAWHQAGMGGGSAASVAVHLGRALPSIQELDHPVPRPPAPAWESLRRKMDALPEVVSGRLALALRPGTAAGDPLQAPGMEAVLWDQAFHLLADGRVRPPGPPPSMAQAQAALSEAVAETGLRAITPTLVQWQSPADLAMLALQVRQANTQLVHVTGMKGGVLGLDGRVALELGKPMAVSGIAGITQRHSTQWIGISAEPSALAHEWFHALDNTLSNLVLSHGAPSSLSVSMGPLRRVADKPAYGAMEDLLEATHARAPQWMALRQERTDPYWVAPDEVLAYGFEAYVSLADPAATALVVDRHEAPLFERWRYPSASEIRALGPYYQRLLQQAARLDLGGAHKARPPAPPSSGRR